MYVVETEGSHVPRTQYCVSVVSGHGGCDAAADHCGRTSTGRTETGQFGG